MPAPVQHAADMEFLVAEGLPSFKFYQGYKGVYFVDDGVLLRGFDHARKLGALPLVQAPRVSFIIELFGGARGSACQEPSH